MTKLPIPTFTLGSTVYLRIDPESRGMVVGYVVRPENTLTYLVRWAEDGVEEVEHWGLELTAEKDYLAGGE